MSEQKGTISYGNVVFSRIIADGSHGNVRAERSIPVLVREGATPPQIAEAEASAWAQAMAQVAETINAEFELEDMPAPMYDGQRYVLCKWKPDPSILLLIPQHSQVPGDIHTLFFQKAHRLPKARELGSYLLATGQGQYTDFWDFADGDFSELEELYQNEVPEPDIRDTDDEPFTEAER